MMRRRGLLFLVPGLALGTALAGMPGEAADDLRGLLVRLTPDVATARRLGRAYLASLASDAGLRAMLARLEAARPQDVAALRDVAAGLARADLARGEVVVVEGWVLARAEAEILALIALA